MDKKATDKAIGDSAVPASIMQYLNRKFEKAVIPRERPRPPKRKHIHSRAKSPAQASPNGLRRLLNSPSLERTEIVTLSEPIPIRPESRVSSKLDTEPAGPIAFEIGSGDDTTRVEAEPESGAGEWLRGISEIARMQVLVDGLTPEGSLGSVPARPASDAVELCDTVLTELAQQLKTQSAERSRLLKDVSQQYHRVFQEMSAQVNAAREASTEMSKQLHEARAELVRLEELEVRIDGLERANRDLSGEAAHHKALAEAAISNLAAVPAWPTWPDDTTTPTKSDIESPGHTESVARVSFAEEASQAGLDIDLGARKRSKSLTAGPAVPMLERTKTGLSPASQPGQTQVVIVHDVRHGPAGVESFHLLQELSTIKSKMNLTIKKLHDKQTAQASLEASVRTLSEELDMARNTIATLSAALGETQKQGYVPKKRGSMELYTTDPTSLGDKSGSVAELTEAQATIIILEDEISNLKSRIESLNAQLADMPDPAALELSEKRVAEMKAREAEWKREIRDLMARVPVAKISTEEGAAGKEPAGVSSTDLAALSALKDKRIVELETALEQREAEFAKVLRRRASSTLNTGLASETPMAKYLPNGATPIRRSTSVIERGSVADVAAMETSQAKISELSQALAAEVAARERLEVTYSSELERLARLENEFLRQFKEIEAASLAISTAVPSTASQARLSKVSAARKPRAIHNSISSDLPEGGSMPADERLLTRMMDRLLHDVEAKVVNEAATCIQAAYRGRLGREVALKRRVTEIAKRARQHQMESLAARVKAARVEFQLAIQERENYERLTNQARDVETLGMAEKDKLAVAKHALQKLGMRLGFTVSLTSEARPETRISLANTAWPSETASPAANAAEVDLLVELNNRVTKLESRLSEIDSNPILLLTETAMLAGTEVINTAAIQSRVTALELHAKELLAAPGIGSFNALESLIVAEEIDESESGQPARPVTAHESLVEPTLSGSASDSPVHVPSLASPLGVSGLASRRKLDTPLSMRATSTLDEVYDALYLLDEEERRSVHDKEAPEPAKHAVVSTSHAGFSGEPESSSLKRNSHLLSRDSRFFRLIDPGSEIKHRTVRSRNWVIRFIRNIYAAMIETIVDLHVFEEGTALDSTTLPTSAVDIWRAVSLRLADFCYECLCTKYGLKQLVDIIDTVSAYRESNKEVGLFAQFLEESLPPQELMHMLHVRFLLSQLKGGYKLPRASDASATSLELVDLERAVETVTILFPRPTPASILNRLEAAARLYPGIDEALGARAPLAWLHVVDLVELVLLHVRQGEGLQRILRWIDAAFAAIDSDADGCVTAEEFSFVFQKVRPPPQKREVNQLYKNAVRVAGTRLMTKQSFVTACTTLLGSEVKLYLPPIETLSARSDSQAIRAAAIKRLEEDQHSKVLAAIRLLWEGFRNDYARYVETLFSSRDLHDADIAKDLERRAFDLENILESEGTPTRRLVRDYRQLIHAVASSQDSARAFRSLDARLGESKYPWERLEEDFAAQQEMIRRVWRSAVASDIEIFAEVGSTELLAATGVSST